MTVGIRDFFCRYKTRETNTLKGISLSIEDGEMVLLAGRSGCGKSTLIKAMTGLLGNGEAVMSGDILLCGNDTKTMTPEDIGLMAGTVYQTPDDQLFAMTVADEVGFALENRGESPETVAREVKKALEKTGLSGFETRSIHALSGGQRQRLALASVLVTHPKLLILDEPVSQMNPAGVRDFLALLATLNREDGMTILVAEHRVNELAKSFPRLLVMSEGEIAYDGPTEEAWSLIGDSETYGLREPQTVRLGRALGLPVLSSDIDITAAQIKETKSLTKEISEISEETVQKQPDFLVCQNLRYTYPGAEAETLHDISFTLSRGTITAVMGENGAGKSTLMNVLAGLTEPDSGDILLEGKPLSRRLGSIGYMRQEADLMLLADTVEEELTFHESHVSEAELTDLLETLHLSAYRRDFPLALSKGQRLRTVFGAILARKKQTLFLLDEPTTGQDRDSLAELKRLLQTAAASGRTILMITHDTEMAADIADRILLMEGGRILADGAPHEILSNRALLETSGLTVPPMLALSEKLSISPCVTIGEVIRHVI